MSYINCKNCNHLFEGNFCSQCGQPAKEHRISASYFLHDIPHSVLHVDKGFPYTFLQLIKRPAKAMEEYLEGKRVNYNRPLAYVIMMSAIGALVSTQIQKLIRELHFKRTGETLVQHENFFSHYQSVFIFLMIPLATLCTWVVFRKNRFNFWEHALINTFMAAQLNVLLVAIHLFSLVKFLITGSAHYNLTIFITGFMTYYALTFSGLMYKEVKGWELGLRLGFMCFLLASIYATCMSFAGILKT